jgi:hypothetical protein
MYSTCVGTITAVNAHSYCDVQLVAGTAAKGTHVEQNLNSCCCMQHWVPYLSAAAQCVCCASKSHHSSQACASFCESCVSLLSSSCIPCPIRWESVTLLHTQTDSYRCIDTGALAAVLRQCQP